MTQSRAEPAGLLRVNASFGFGRAHIAPAISRFSERFPSMKIQLHLTDRPLSLQEEGFDLGIRFGDVPDARINARLLLKNQRLACASPAYLKRYGAPTMPHDLTRHACLVLRENESAYGTWHFSRPGGSVRAQVREDGLVSVDMGIPNFDPKALPMQADGEALTYSVQIDGRAVDFGAVSMGNPHVVLRVADVDAAPVASLGPAIERAPRFPNRTNVGFLQILDRGHIRLRVFERGAGETQACGTGACAAVAIGRRWDLLDAELAMAARQSGKEAANARWVASGK